jgi:hypothetical protein
MRASPGADVCEQALAAVSELCRCQARRRRTPPRHRRTSRFRLISASRTKSPHSKQQNGRPGKRHEQTNKRTNRRKLNGTEEYARALVVARLSVPPQIVEALRRLDRDVRRVPLSRLSVPLSRLSVPLSRSSVPLSRLSVPLSRLSVPLSRLSVPPQIVEALRRLDRDVRRESLPSSAARSAGDDASAAAAGGAGPPRPSWCAARWDCGLSACARRAALSLLRGGAGAAPCRGRASAVPNAACWPGRGPPAVAVVAVGLLSVARPKHRRWAASQVPVAHVGHRPARRADPTLVPAGARVFVCLCARVLVCLFV